MVGRRSVYTCGLGITGQMGDGGLSGHSVPTLVPGLEGKGVEVVSCSQGQVRQPVLEGSLGMAVASADMLCMA